MELLFFAGALVGAAALWKLSAPRAPGLQAPPPGSSGGGGSAGSGGGGTAQIGGSPPPKLGGGPSVPTSVGQLVTDVLGVELTIQDFNTKGHPTISGNAGAFAATGAAVILAVGISSPYAVPIAIALLAIFNLAGAVEETVRNQASLAWLKKMAAQYRYDNYGRWLNPRAVFEFYLAGVTANPTDQAGGWDGVPLGNQGGFSTTLPQQADGSFVDDDSDAAQWKAYLGLDAPETFTLSDGTTHNTRQTIKAATLWALAQPYPAQALDQVHKLCDAIATTYPWVTGIRGLSGHEVTGALYWTPKPRPTTTQIAAQQAQQQTVRQQTQVALQGSRLTGGAASTSTSTSSVQGPPPTQATAGSASNVGTQTQSTTGQHAGGQQSKGGANGNAFDY